MKTYRVWVSWIETGYYDIDIDSEEEAKEIAYDKPNLPEERGDMVSDSFQVDSVEETK